MDPGVILLGGLLILLVLMYQRSGKQRRELAALQQSLVPGAKVMTSAGLYATVRTVEGDVVTLETGPDQLSRWDRRAVVRVLPDEAAAAEPEPGTQSQQPADLRTPDDPQPPDTNPPAER